METSTLSMRPSTCFGHLRFCSLIRESTFLIYYYILTYSDVYINSESQDGLDTCVDSECLIKSDGSVSCSNACVHTAFCDDSDFKNWPYDSHTCEFHFVSQTKNTEQLKFAIASNNSMPQDNRHGNWMLKSSSVQNIDNKIVFDKFQKSHSGVKIKLEIQRRAEGFKYQVIIPALIISMSNILFFTLEPSSYERIVLLVMNILSNFTYIEQLRWMLPHDGEQPPSILVFFMASQFITVCLVFYSIIMATTGSDEKPSLWKLKMISDAGTFKVTKFFFILVNCSDDEKKWVVLTERLVVGILIVVYGVMFFDTLIPL